MGYIELNEELIKDIEKETTSKFRKIGNLVPLEEIESTLEDLMVEIHRLQEQVEKMEEELDEYKERHPFG